MYYLLMKLPQASESDPTGYTVEVLILMGRWVFLGPSPALGGLLNETFQP
jgi:hypothetical protein